VNTYSHSCPKSKAEEYHATKKAPVTTVQGMNAQGQCDWKFSGHVFLAINFSLTANSYLLKKKEQLSD
jgi:hypothetical protein